MHKFISNKLVLSQLYDMMFKLKKDGTLITVRSKDQQSNHRYTLSNSRLKDSVKQNNMINNNSDLIEDMS